MILDELLFKLGVKADTTKLKEFATTLDKVENNSAAKSLDNVSHSAQKAGNAGEKAAEKTGNAFDKAKGKISKFTGVLTFFIGMASALSMGLVRGFNSMLAKIDDLAKSKNQLFQITQKEVQQAKEYTANVERTGNFIQSLKVRIGLGLLPVLNRLVEAFTALMVNNKTLISEGLVFFLKILLGIVEVFLRFIGATDKVIKGTIGWKTVLLSLVVVLGYVKRAMLLAFITNPITWVVLAIVGVIGLIDDLLTYLRGGKSAFPQFWGPAIAWCKKAWAVIEPFYKFLVRTLSYAIGFAVGLWEEFSKFIKKIFGIWADDSATLGEKLQSTFFAAVDFIKGIFEKAFEFILSLFGVSLEDVGKFIQKLKDKFFAVIDIIKQPFITAFDYVKDLYNKTIGAIAEKLNWLGQKLGLVKDDLNDVGKAVSYSDLSKNLNNMRAMEKAQGRTLPPSLQGGDVNANITIYSPNPLLAGESVNKSLAPAYGRANNNMLGGVKY